MPRRRLAKFGLAAAIAAVMCTSVACSDDTHNAAANATTSSAAHSESPAAATSAEVVVQNLKFEVQACALQGLPHQKHVWLGIFHH